jgi:hypothetical protein
MSYGFRNNEMKVMLHSHIYQPVLSVLLKTIEVKTNKRVFINAMLYYDRALKRILNSVCLFIFRL